MITSIGFLQGFALVLILALGACVSEPAVILSPPPSAILTPQPQPGIQPSAPPNSNAGSRQERTARRVALVVGNGAYQYQNVPILKNTVNDAQASAEALKSKGYKVLLTTDVSFADFLNSLREFGKLTKEADESVFMFFGHAAEIDGKNWLIAVDANPSSDDDMTYQAIDLANVRQEADKARRALIFLDACRDNPFSMQRESPRRGSGGLGLRQVDAAEGEIIAYSTKPNSVAMDGTGDHSPWDSAFLEHIKEPNINITNLLQKIYDDVKKETGGLQVPWNGGNFAQPFVFYDAPGEIRVLTKSGFPQFELDTPGQKTILPPQEYRDWLSSTLDVLHLSRDDHDSILRAYSQAKAGKGLSVAADLKATFIVQSAPSGALAIEMSNERCEIATGIPCAPVAIDDQPADNPRFELQPIEMPRVLYRGEYDPQQVPGVTPQMRGRFDVVGYGSAMRHKAMALDRWGEVFSVIGAANANDAQSQVLATCNAERHGPCVLYAVDNEVVLPRRAMTPIVGTVEKPLDAHQFQQSLPAANGTPHEILARTMLKLIPNLQPEDREKWVDSYFGISTPHKALFVSVDPPGFSTIATTGSLKTVEEIGFERCEATFGAPCVEVAFDGQIKEGAAASDARRMPRVTYSGEFNPERIPGLLPVERDASDLGSYSVSPGPRAAVLNPLDGKVALAFGENELLAEQRALASCKAEAHGTDATCYIYSVYGRVVFPERHTEPF